MFKDAGEERVARDEGGGPRERREEAGELRLGVYEPS